MGKTLTPKQAAAELGKTTETLRRWRREGNVHAPPWTYEGGRPRYRSDLLHAGSYAVGGYVERFPAPKTEVIDATDMSEPEKRLLEALLSKLPVQALEDGDDLFVVVDSDELDTSDPAALKALGTLAKMARGAR